MVPMSMAARFSAHEGSVGLGRSRSWCCTLRRSRATASARNRRKITIVSLRFEWDEEKAAENLRKHKISFDEAKTIFGDPALLTVLDDKHSDEEDRFISVGTSNQTRILLAVHTE